MVDNRSVMCKDTLARGRIALESSAFCMAWKRDGQVGQGESQGHTPSGMGGPDEELGFHQWAHRAV